MKTLIVGTIAAILLAGLWSSPPAAGAGMKYKYRLLVKYDVRNLHVRVKDIAIQCAVWPTLRRPKKFKAKYGRSDWISGDGPKAGTAKGVAEVTIDAPFFAKEWKCWLYLKGGGFRKRPSFTNANLFLRALPGSVLEIGRKTKFKFPKMGKGRGR